MVAYYVITASNGMSYAGRSLSTAMMFEPLCKTYGHVSRLTFTYRNER